MESYPQVEVKRNKFSKLLHILADIMLKFTGINMPTRSSSLVNGTYLVFAKTNAYLWQTNPTNNLNERNLSYVKPFLQSVVSDHLSKICAVVVKAGIIISPIFVGK